MLICLCMKNMKYDNFVVISKYEISVTLDLYYKIWRTKKNNLKINNLLKGLASALQKALAQIWNLLVPDQQATSYFNRWLLDDVQFYLILHVCFKIIPF